MFWYILAILGFGMGLFGMIEPLNRWFTYEANKHFPNRELSPENLAELRFQGLIDEKSYYERMKLYGYDEKKAEEFYKVRKRLLTAEELTEAYWRGFIKWEDYVEYMKKLGFDEPDIQIFEEVRRFYPSPSDLIRFAVRDVYNEQIVKKYGYDEEFPQNIVEDVKKVGMDEKWIRAYWRAHWELPSPTQAYEMLHRLNPEVLKIRAQAYEKMGLKAEDIVTNLDTIRDLLKIADYPKYWRDRLIAIAYNPLTRVDLRRIYELGLIERDELIARLMELGYTKDDAELLAQFYDLLKNQETLDSIRAHLDDLYIDGVIDEEEYRKYLKELGYSDDEIQLNVLVANHRKNEQIRKENMKYLEIMFRKGLMTEDEVRDRLSKIGVQTEEINRIVSMWKARRERTKLPLSKSDIENAYKYNVIDENEAKELLKKLNYDDEAIELIIKTWNAKYRGKVHA